MADLVAYRFPVRTWINPARAILAGRGAVLGAALASAATPALAFPPYRSADAFPPTPYELGVRVGLARLQRDKGQTHVAAPLLRMALGLPKGFEVISQLEYAPRRNAIGDGALGGRWATLVTPRVGAGVESLALLPVGPGSAGIGAETLFVASVRGDGYRLHLNAGGFHDPRFGPAATGWRASALGEIVRDDLRVGLEIFGKDSDRGEADLRAGAGLIRKIGQFDVRGAVHLGLSQAAPDVTTSVWITTSFPVRQ